MENSMGTRKVLYLLLAFCVAAILWFFVDTTNDKQVEREITDIPIVYTDEDTVLADRGLMLLEENTDGLMDVTVKGKRWDVSQMDSSSIRVIVELKNVTSPGEQRVPYQLSVVSKFDDLVQVTKKSISMATVNISELYSKQVEVKCELVGNVAEGYNAGQLQISHSKIDIWGQQEIIDQVAYAKVKLDIGNATGSVSETLDVQYCTEDGQMLESAGIRTTVEKIQVSLPVFVTKELRLVVNFLDGPGCRARNAEYFIEPATIAVSGDATKLKNVEILELKPDYDLRELGTTASENYTTTNYPIILPEGCTNVSGVTRAALRIRFKDMTSATVTTENISWLNLPEGKRVEVLTSSLPVKVFGTEADVSALTGEDIAVTVDLVDYSAASGTYTVPAEVTVTKGDVGISGLYQIQVTIREGVEEPPPEEPGAPPSEGEPAGEEASG